jgi:hypothetical protein
MPTFKDIDIKKKYSLTLQKIRSAQIKKNTRGKNFFRDMKRKSGIE